MAQSPVDVAPSLPAQVISTDDVIAWLHHHELAQHAPLFRDNDIDGYTLRTLSSAELRDDLQVISLRHRRVLLSAIAQLPALPITTKYNEDDNGDGDDDDDDDTPSQSDHQPNRDRDGVFMFGLFRRKRRRAASDSAPRSAQDRGDQMPEHGRILDHLSNVRTYHSWLRVGVQFLSFAIVTLRLAPDFRYTSLVSAVAFYFASVALFAMLYAAFRYRKVIRMIEQSRLSKPKYEPDVFGAVVIVVLLISAAILSIVVISLPAPAPV